jgi:hypothetical protein
LLAFGSARTRQAPCSPHGQSMQVKLKSLRGLTTANFNKAARQRMEGPGSAG